MKLKKILHAIHWLLFIFNLLDFLIFFFKIKNNLFWLNLSWIIRMAKMTICSISPSKHISIFRKSHWKCFGDFDISNWNLIIKLVFLIFFNYSFKLNFFWSKFKIIHLRISQIEIIWPPPSIKLVLFRDLKVLLISVKLLNEFFLIIINLEGKKVNWPHSVNICLIQKFINNFLSLSSLFHTTCLNIFQLLRSYWELLFYHSKNTENQFNIWVFEGVMQRSLF